MLQPSESGQTQHPDVTSDGAANESRTPGGNQSCSRQRIVAIALTAGVAAGIVSWIACEWSHDLFRPRLFGVPRWEAVWMEATPESEYAADLKNAALAKAVLGCAVGLAMGIAGGVAARAPSRGIVVGLTAQAAGLLVGALAALAVIPVFQRSFRTTTNDIWPPLAMHAGIWAAVGAVGGAAFAIGMGCRARLLNAIGSATLGALVAAVFFQLIGTCLPLNAGAMSPIARWSIVRLVATLLPIFMIAAGAALGTVGHARPSDPSHRPGPPGGCPSSLETSSRLPK
jgi:hypothetical protein